MVTNNTTSNSNDTDNDKGYYTYLYEESVTGTYQVVLAEM